MSEISQRVDLNTCTYSEPCKAVAEASESISFIPHCKNRCPWENDIVKKARRDPVEAKRRSRSQPSPAHTEMTLSAAYDSEQVKYYEALITEVENACIEGQHSKTWRVIADISGKKRKQSHGVSADTQEELTKIWETHFWKLLSPEIPSCEVLSNDPVVPPEVLFQTDPLAKKS